MIRVDALLDAAWEQFPVSLRETITRYIHPTTRRPLAYVTCLILMVATYRFVLHGPRLVFGALPGDIYYHSDNVMVSAPLLSCFLLSMGFNFIVRLLR
jgi:hypothetical protein